MEKFYDKSKPYFLIENTDDRITLMKLIEVTYNELPVPKEKKKQKRE
jgi:hypothetical protein